MPKTLRNKFDECLTYENLMKAHKRSSTNKNCRRDVITFNLKKEAYIQYLYEELKNQTYKHGPYSIFYVHEPKLRKVQKSRYIDRVVHRWVVDNFLAPTYLPQFITTSYACIPDKGMHRASLAVKEAMLHCKRIWGNYYIIKMDVKKYFQSINREVLKNILARKIKDKKLKWLVDEIISSSEGETGIPIGNYTSQIFANIYLNEVDQYIKHELKVKYYYRYMDDSIVLVKTKEEAKEVLTKIIEYLRNNLKLELNSKTQIFKSKQGVNFCGYKINEYRMKLRERGKKKLKKKIKNLKKQIKDGQMTSKEARKYLCGHMGYIQYANIHKLKKLLFFEE